MYWNPTNIFLHRDKILIGKDNKPFTLKLYEDGWAFEKLDKMDILNACYVLNCIEAKPS